MSDLTAMVLMVIVTLMALSIIWGTYFNRRPLERERSEVAGC
jgi:cell division protein FtsL